MIWLALVACAVIVVGAVLFLRALGRVLEDAERLRRIREEADE